VLRDTCHSGSFAEATQDLLYINNELWISAQEPRQRGEINDKFSVITPQAAIHCDASKWALAFAGVTP
jgi:hypothetical protein